MNNHSAKFEYRGLKIWKQLELLRTQPRHYLSKYVQDPKKMKKIIFVKCAKWMNTVGVTDYTNWAPLGTCISNRKISKFNTLQKWENIYQMCIIKKCTSTTCEHSVCKVWTMLELQFTQTRLPLCILDGKIQHPSEKRKHHEMCTK